MKVYSKAGMCLKAKVYPEARIWPEVKVLLKTKPTYTKLVVMNNMAGKQQSVGAKDAMLPYNNTAIQ